MSTLATELLACIAATIHSPKLLPERFYSASQKQWYNIGYEREEDDSSIRFIALMGKEAKAILELRGVYETQSTQAKESCQTSA